MTTATVITCDRCKADSDKADNKNWGHIQAWRNGRSLLGHDIVAARTFDLCPNCAASLASWWIGAGR